MKNSEGTYALINVNLGKFDLNPKQQLQSATSAEQKEYEEFRTSVIKKYGL